MFCALNGFTLEVPPDEAVETMLAVAAGELEEPALSAWLLQRLKPPPRGPSDDPDR